MPVFPVAATDGQGVDALRAHLHEAAQAMPQAQGVGGFRLAVDRSFTLKGAGTVVTGTVFAGRVAVGDELAVTPSGKRVRVRSLHVMNRPAQGGQAGQRCALNLHGVGKDEIARGDWIVAPHLHAPTARFDVRLRLSPQAPVALTHWAPVHLHLGAAHVMARVALLEGERLAPGENALAQLVADRPLGALHGDCFIVRDADARHTLGGGVVLDPDAPARKRKTPLRLAELAALDIPDTAQRLRALLGLRGLDLVRLAVHWNARRIWRRMCRPTARGCSAAMKPGPFPLRTGRACRARCAPLSPRFTNAFPTNWVPMPRVPGACSCRRCRPPHLLP